MYKPAIMTGKNHLEVDLLFRDRNDFG